MTDKIWNAGDMHYHLQGNNISCGMNTCIGSCSTSKSDLEINISLMVDIDKTKFFALTGSFALSWDTAPASTRALNNVPSIVFSGGG
jgi:hypothetical protein